VQLLDVIFGHGYVVPRIEHEFRGFRISRDLLFVPRPERSQIQIREQKIDLAIGQLRAFDSRRRSYRLHSCDVPQRRQPIGRKIPESLPCSFEFVDFTDKSQEI
jgi:hypothetical protein